MNRFSLPREHYIPAAAKGTEPLRPEGTALEIYLYASTRGEPALCAFLGKAAKPIAHFRFSSEADRTKRIDGMVAGQRARAAARAERVAANKAYQHDYKVGDILVSTWGYDQTNVYFYQVTGLKGASLKSIEVRRIGSTEVPDKHSDSMHGKVVAAKDQFLEGHKAFTVRVGSGGSINVNSDGYGSAHRWDGEPMHYSCTH